MSKDYIFTSESVSEGIRQVADQISDAVLDGSIVGTPDHAKARVACETLVKTGLVMLAGEITHRRGPGIDYEKVVRRGRQGHRLRQFRHRLRLANTCAVLNALGKQSPDINQGVDRDRPHEAGRRRPGPDVRLRHQRDRRADAGADHYAHRLVKRQAEVRKNGTLPWLRPDAKSQITFRYADGKPVAIDAVVLSTQHEPTMSAKACCTRRSWRRSSSRCCRRRVVAQRHPLSHQPDRQFVIGGPVGDCGLTGRKIIVDTYGGMARHGGGAFSGKDPSKVDRSAAYAGRYVAKNIVAAGLAEKLRDPGLLRHRRRRTDLDHGRTPSAPARSPRTGSSNWSANISTCVPAASSACSTCCGRSIARPRAYGHFGRDEHAVHLGADRQGGDAARRRRTENRSRL